jgi:hypothetical protein
VPNRRVNITKDNSRNIGGANECPQTNTDRTTTITTTTTAAVNFYNSDFYDKTYFSGEFNGKTTFHYVLFEGKEKVIFDIENLSNVSFMSTDLTGVKFSDNARWGEEEERKLKKMTDSR